MNNKEKLQQKIGIEIGKVSVASMSKVTGRSRSYIQQRIYGDVGVSPEFYDQMIEGYEFIIEAQKTIYKR